MQEMKDFLTTYGWAIAVIFIFIVVVLAKPTIFIPDSEEGIQIIDQKLDHNGTLEVFLKNNIDADVSNVMIEITSCSKSSEAIDLKKFETDKVTLSGCGQFKRGSSFNKDATISYSTIAGTSKISHTVTRIVKAIVE